MFWDVSCLSGRGHASNPTLMKYYLYNETGLAFGRFKGTFNEYLPVYELAESGTAFDGALLFFNFYFKRSQQYYVFNLIVSDRYMLTNGEHSCVAQLTCSLWLALCNKGPYDYLDVCEYGNLSFGSSGGRTT